jgi:hypothetical protein
MKKNLLLVFSIVLFAACSGTKKPTAETAAANALLQTPAPTPVVDLAKRSHKIPFDSAALLVADALNNTALNKLLTSYSFGGTFPVKLFRVSPDSSGIILWSCFKGGKKPEFYLAIEQLKSYDTTNLPKAPTSKTLMRPQFLFKNAMSKPYTTPAVKRFIENQIIPKNGATSIDNASVVKNISSFDSLMAAMPDGSGKKYNEHPFSYFRESTDGTFSKFLDQAGANGFVRYYFAFDEKEKPNRIRVILVAVDAAGKNITKTAATAATSGGDALILQKSIPPPPYNN